MGEEKGGNGEGFAGPVSNCVVRACCAHVLIFRANDCSLWYVNRIYCGWHTH